MNCEACAPNRADHIREASDLLQELFWRGSIGRRVRDAQSILCRKPYQWTRNRVREVFDGKSRTVHSHEMDHLRALKRVREIKEAEDEFREIDALRDRLARLETFLAVSDEAFHRPTIEALRGSESGAGGVVAGSRKGGDD